MFIILTQRLSWEGCELEASLGYIVRVCLQISNESIEGRTLGLEKEPSKQPLTEKTRNQAEEP